MKWSAKWFFLPAAILFFGLFGKAIWPENQFVYRDVSYFYYPLYRQVQEELNAGRLPLWDDRSNFGQPLLANPATGVFYPPKLIFFVTKFFPDSYGLCYKTFILLHFPVAMAGIYFLLRRRFGRGAAASALAATVYAFCGPIFFQYANVIFLIGAAWLPWIILAGDRLLVERSIRSILWLGVFLALVVTGGEPQTAYVAGLILLGLWFIRRRRAPSTEGGGTSRETTTESASKRRREERKKRAVRPRSRQKRLLQSGPVLLLAGAIFGATLSAAVVLPAIRAERLSHRNHKVFPTSVWELPRFLWTGRVSSLLPPDYRLTGPVGPQVGQSRGEVALDGLFCRYQKLEGHENQVYDYSHAPWRFPEFLWPHYAGNDLVRSGSEWKTTLPNEFGWVQTSYMGILPLVFALTVFQLRRGKPRKSSHLPVTPNVAPAVGALEPEKIVRWASWGGILFLLAALGGFGPWWFVRAAMSLVGLSDAPLRFDNGDPVGGVYWVMNVFLPKFSTFRFPAKMLTPALFFFSILAAFGWDALAGQESEEGGDAAIFRQRAIRIVVVILTLTGIVFAVAILWGPNRLYSGVVDTTCYGGPFEKETAFRFLLLSLLQPTVVLLLFFPLLLRRKTSSRFRSFLAPVALLLTAADLWFAEVATVPVISQKKMDETPLFAKTLEKNRGNRTNPVEGPSLPIRINGYFSWNDPRFSSGNSDRRCLDYYDWFRRCRVSRFSTLDRIAIFPDTGTLMPSDSWQLLNWTILLTDRGSDESRRNLAAEIFAALDVEFYATQTGHGEPIPNLETLVGDYERFPAGPERDREIDRLDQEGWPVGTTLGKTTLPTSRVRIVRPLPTTPTDDEMARCRELLRPEPVDMGPDESAKIVEYRPGWLVLEVRLDRASDVVLAEQFWPGWKATVSPLTDEDSIVPTEDLSRRRDAFSASSPANHRKTGDALAARRKISSGIDRTIQKDAIGLGVRRLSLPAGKWRVEMNYRPTEVRLGVTLSLLAILVGLFLVFFTRQKAANVTATITDSPSRPG